MSIPTRPRKRALALLLVLLQAVLAVVGLSCALRLLRHHLARHGIRAQRAAEQQDVGLGPATTTTRPRKQEKEKKSETVGWLFFRKRLIGVGWEDGVDGRAFPTALAPLHLNFHATAHASRGIVWAEGGRAGRRARGQLSPHPGIQKSGIPMTQARQKKTKANHTVAGTPTATHTALPPTHKPHPPCTIQVLHTHNTVAWPHPDKAGGQAASSGGCSHRVFISFSPASLSLTCGRRSAPSPSTAAHPNCATPSLTESCPWGQTWRSPWAK